VIENNRVRINPERVINRREQLRGMHRVLRRR
jgi:hypothetical protein